MPKRKINVEGVIQRIIDYQAWIADGKLGDERNRLNPILNDTREALTSLKYPQRRIKRLQTRIDTLTKIRKDHEETIKEFEDGLTRDKKLKELNERVKKLEDQLAKKRG